MVVVDRLPGEPPPSIPPVFRQFLSPPEFGPSAALLRDPAANPVPARIQRPSISLKLTFRSPPVFLLEAPVAIHAWRSSRQFGKLLAPALTVTTSAKGEVRIDGEGW